MEQLSYTRNSIIMWRGHVGDEMKKRCFKKVQKCLTEKGYFFTRYRTKQLAKFCSVKDFIPTLQK